MGDRKSVNLKQEFIGGLTTFLTMAYIVVVNPAILASPGTGMAFSGVLTATVLLAFSMTLLMGIYAKLPFAVAPGMGINAFFTFTVILGQKIPWQMALGMVVWAGVLFILVSVTPLRVKIAQAIPENLRAASAVGIGLFLTFIGLKNAGLVVSDPVTFVKLGALNAKPLLAIAGMVVMGWLLVRRSPVAFLLGIVGITLAGLALGLVQVPDQWVSAPDFTSVMFQADIWGALKWAFVPVILSILFTDLFDSISTFVGVSQAAGLVDKNGDPKNLKQGLVVDALATFFAGLFGTSSGTAYIESAAGIEAGGRTGWTAVFAALFFIPCLFIAPLAAMVPDFATAPVLVIVGCLMFRSVHTLNLKKLEDALPAFLTVVLIPLTFSITQGILWGFLTHVLLYVIVGRGREVRPMMYGLGGLSAFLIYLQQANP